MKLYNYGAEKSVKNDMVFLNARSIGGGREKVEVGGGK